VKSSIWPALLVTSCYPKLVWALPQPRFTQPVLPGPWQDVPLPRGEHMIHLGLMCPMFVIASASHIRFVVEVAM